jgi:RsiW-degrading membrane proteinase PrsW (M82 family)
MAVMPTFVVGLIEESAKLLVPLALLLLTGYRSAADGLVIGVTVGMGFAVLETMGYGFVTLLLSKGNIGAVEQLLFLRGVLAPAAHLAWTGLSCAALHRAWSSGRPRAVLAFVGMFVLVVVLHGLWDAMSSPLAYLVLGLVSLGLLGREVRRTLLPGRAADRGLSPASN